MFLSLYLGSLVETDKSEIFGEMASHQSEIKAEQNSSHVMPIPLQTSQRYTLTEENEVRDGIVVLATGAVSALLSGGPPPFFRTLHLSLRPPTFL